MCPLQCKPRLINLARSAHPGTGHSLRFLVTDWLLLRISRPLLEPFLFHPGVFLGISGT
jgi:hypothetical protein